MLALSKTRRPFGSAVSGVAAGMLYEQTVEWGAHGWLQSQPVEGLEFFRWRHGRHHKDPESHHALQPISIWGPVVAGLLSPALAGAASKNHAKRNFALGTIAGFLATHALLNVAHYDIHAKNKIIPEPLRNTRYYKGIERIHNAHHNGSEQRIYGITNPWLDIGLERAGASKAMDKVFPFLGRAAQRLDPLWMRLDSTWRRTQQNSTDIRFRATDKSQVEPLE